MRRALVLAFVSLLALRLPAQSDTFRAGLKSFTIPAPSADLAETGSDYRVLLEPLVTNTNRLVAGFVSSDDLNLLRTSTGTALSRYAMVQVARRAEFADISPDAFKQFVDKFGSQFGATIDATLKDQQDEVNRRIKDRVLGLSAKTVTLDKPLQLGAFFNKPDAASYGLVMPVSVDGNTKKVVVNTIVLRVRQRLLFLYLIEEYKDESSVQWVRTTGEHWTDAILAANKE